MDDIWEDPDFLLQFIQWCALVIIWKKRQRRLRRWWVRPINENRSYQGDFEALFQELKDDTVMFFRYTRMTVDTFYTLLEMIAPKLQKRNWRALSPELRLSSTLRYLATGDQVLSLALAYRIGESTTYNIIKETTEAIVEVLFHRFVPPPVEADYRRFSAGFLDEWNFPNCVGAVDGKHCIIQAPARSGSLFFNYKKTFSVVLMAACDHNYKFTLIDVGAYGSQNDAGVFAESEFGKLLKEERLNLPKERVKLPGDDESTSFFFIGDDAFPLSKHLMKPYSGTNLDEKKRIFNYRLSRARRTIENAFGILVSRWRVLRRPICMHPKTADKIILSTVCLHNFLKSIEDQQTPMNRFYCPPNYVDGENNNGEIINGAWREINDMPLRDLVPTNGRRATMEAYAQRETLANYFLTPAGEVPWQHDYIRRGQNRDQI